MNEQKNTRELPVQDNVTDKVADSLVKILNGIVTHIQTNIKEDKNEEIKPILQEIKDSLKKQNQINNELYDNLIYLQNDSLRRTLLNPIIGIYGLMEENLDYIINKMPEDFEDNLQGKLDKVTELFVFIKNRIQEMFIYHYGLRLISPSEGDLFNPDEHCIAGTEPTSDESLKNTIIRIDKIGFKDAKNNSICKRAEVITMTYTEESHSDDNNSTNN